MIARLTALLFIEILRLHLAELRDHEVGWFAALKDRHIGRALNMFHSQPRERWTIEMLAREIGLSRSVFARRFHHLLNMFPTNYLRTWRLHLAAHDPKSSCRSK